MSEATPRVSDASASTVASIIAMFDLSIRQLARGRRLLVLVALFLLPTALAVLVRVVQPNRNPDHFAFVLILNLLPHALVPLVALLYASGMIQDEIEEQTLTYLLIRPVPKWAIYLVKLLAAWLVSVALTAVFVTLTYLTLYVGDERLVTVLTVQAPRTALLLSLSLLAYTAIFGFLSLVVKRTLVTGVGYVIVLEWTLANIDFALRRVTVMYYFRVLALNWLPINEGDGRTWRIDLAAAPSPTACVVTLLCAAAVFTILATRVFMMREFRVKTPEGS
jgi:ABC-2 type transport system permease protein